MSSTDWSCIVRAQRSYEPALRTWLMHKVQDSARVDDLLQEVWLRALEHQRAFCSVTYTKAWLFRVAHNLVVDQWRAARDHVTDLDLLQEVAIPEEQNHALEQCLTHRLARLSAEDQAILEACELGGMRLKEYAYLHALSLSATKARLARARKRLRKALEQACAHTLQERSASAVS